MRTITKNGRQCVETSDFERREYRKMINAVGLVEVRRQHPNVPMATIVENVPREWCVQVGEEWQWKARPDFREFQSAPPAREQQRRAVRQEDLW